MSAVDVIALGYPSSAQPPETQPLPISQPPETQPLPISPPPSHLHLPFFPLPEPPPAAAPLPLQIPHPPHPTGAPSTALIVAASVSIVLAFAIAFAAFRRSRSQMSDYRHRSPKHRKQPSLSSAKLLYLGNFVNSYPTAMDRRVASPELQPMPPLKIPVDGGADEGETSYGSTSNSSSTTADSSSSPSLSPPNTRFWILRSPELTEIRPLDPLPRHNHLPSPPTS